MNGSPRAGDKGDGKSSPGAAVALESLRLYERGAGGADTFGLDGYPTQWHTTVKHLVRDQAGHRCVRCGHPFEVGATPGMWSPCDERCHHGGEMRAWTTEGWSSCSPTPEACGSFVHTVGKVEAKWRVLTVHHLDGDKANCRWWNLAALCQRCHLEIQGRVRMEREWHHEHTAWFRPYVAGYYAFTRLGQDLTRPEVEARLDELLALQARQQALAMGVSSEAPKREGETL